MSAFFLTLGLWLSLPAPSPISSEDLEKALRAAEDMEGQRAFDASRRQYWAVVEHATDPSTAGRAWLRMCNVWWLAADVERTQSCYRELMGSTADPNAMALAGYRVVASGTLDWPDAQAQLLHVVKIWPETVGAERALMHLLGKLEERSGRLQAAHEIVELAAFLRERMSSSDDPEAVSKLACRALVWAGDMLIGEQHAKAAEQVFRDGLALATHRAWRDASIMGLARSLFLQGRADQALEMYDRVIDAHSSAWSFGSYTSAWLEEAFLQKGRLLEKLGRMEAARKVYSQWMDTLPHSRAMHLAAFRRARILHAQSDPRALQEFVRQFPGSRYASEARRLLERHDD